MAKATIAAAAGIATTGRVPSAGAAGITLGQAMERAMSAAIIKATTKYGITDPDELRRISLEARQEVKNKHQEWLDHLAAKAKAAAELDHASRR